MMRLIELLAQKKTLILATANLDGAPTASYCPYVRLGNNFFVYVSTLSRHTHDLGERARASIMFIEDESQADNVLAMRRLTLDCDAKLVEKNNEMRESILDIFEKRFGKPFKLVRPFSDFRLYAFTPRGGIFVCGFARAYRVNEKIEMVEHLNAEPHNPTPPEISS